MIHTRRILLVVAAALAAAMPTAFAQNAASLEQSFRTPPDAAKPPAPPSNNGPFLGMRNAPDLGFPPEKDLPGAKPMAAEPPAAPDPTYYADVKVIAYRLPEGDVSMADAHPRVTSATGDVDGAALMDGDVSKTISFALPDGAPETWVQLEFATPHHAEALTLAGPPTMQFVGGPP